MKTYKATCLIIATLLLANTHISGTSFLDLKNISSKKKVTLIATCITTAVILLTAITTQSKNSNRKTPQPPASKLLPIKDKPIATKQSLQPKQQQTKKHIIPQQKNEQQIANRVIKEKNKSPKISIPLQLANHKTKQVSIPLASTENKNISKLKPVESEDETIAIKKAQDSEQQKIKEPILSQQQNKQPAPEPEPEPEKQILFSGLPLEQIVVFPDNDNDNDNENKDFSTDEQIFFDIIEKQLIVSKKHHKKKRIKQHIPEKKPTFAEIVAMTEVTNPGVAEIMVVQPNSKPQKIIKKIQRQKKRSRPRQRTIRTSPMSPNKKIRHNQLKELALNRY